MKICDECKIDWLTITVQPINLQTLYMILHLKLKFNIFFKENFRSKWEDLHVSKNYTYQVVVTKLPTWKLVKLEFSGENADYLYNCLLKTNKTVFPEELKPNLSRVDIKYCRPIKSTDNDRIRFFLKLCESNLENINSNGKKMAIGKRITPNSALLNFGFRARSFFYRIYQSASTLDFELEIKKSGTRKFNRLLFQENNLIELKKQLVEKLCAFSRQHLVLESSFMDWVAEYQRETSDPDRYEKSFVIEYLKESNQLQTILDKENFFKLAQLLAYLNEINRTVYTLNQERCMGFYEFEFRIVDYLSFIGTEPSQYSVKQTALFFDSLMRIDPLSFANFKKSYYVKYIPFPEVSVEKRGRYLSVNMLVNQKLYKWHYPFILPQEFLISPSNTRHTCARYALLHSLTANSNIEKIFEYENFLNKQQNVFTNKGLKELRLHLIDDFNLLIRNQKIKKFFRILTRRDQNLEVNEINLTILKQTQTIYFYEILR